MHEDFSNPVRKFISENFLFREDTGSLADDDSFLEAGIIDSTGVLELISFLEDTYKIEVTDEEMLPENFDSIRRIVAYLDRKVQAAQALQDECAREAGIAPLFYAG